MDSSDFYNAYKYIITKLIKSNGIENLSCRDKNKMLKRLRKNPLLVGPVEPVGPTKHLIVIEAAIRMTGSVQRDAAIAASIPIQIAVRKEPGCMVYCFAADPVESDLIQVFELWKDAATLTAHFEYPNYKNMLDNLEKFGLKSVVSRKYRVDTSAPVYGPDSNPTPDFDIPDPKPK